MGDCGSFYRENLDLVKTSHRSKLISFIKTETSEGKNRMVYKGNIDSFSLEELRKQGFVVKQDFCQEESYIINL